MWKRVLFVCSLLALLVVSPARAANPRSARIMRLENAVLAPCCYTEPVSRHQSEIALKMRLEIAKWVEQDRTDDEILGEYVRRYGAKVLVDPATLPKGWSYLVPWAIVFMAVIGTGALIRKWHSGTHTASPAGIADFSDLPEPED